MIADIIRRRRMTRRFAGSLDTAWVEAQCDVARRAPSAGYAQGTHFLILTGDELAEFWSSSGLASWFTRRSPGVLGASAVVLVLGDRSAYTSRYSEPDKQAQGLESTEAWSTPYWLTDAAMAAQNLLLLAEDDGVGALFFGLFVESRRILDGLGVPADVDCVGAIALGPRDPADRPTGSPTRRPRRAVGDVVHRGHW